MFGINHKNEITPLGGKPEHNERSVATATREFFEETINTIVPYSSQKIFEKILKDTAHYKYVCRNQVYYLTNVNIFSNPIFNSLSGSTFDGIQNKIINLSQFSSNNKFNALQFITYRGEEKRHPNNGLYEVKQLVAINLTDFRNYIKQNYAGSELQYGPFLIRGDLKKCVQSGFLDFI